MEITALNILPPSGVAEAIRSMRGTGTSLYVHGSPGISKSAVALQIANEANIAFIDFRLSQVAPEDIRGVPMPGEVDHMKGIIWIPPMIFPRDLDYQGVDTVDATGIYMCRFFNPVGNNGVHYCTLPNIEVTPQDANHIVSVQTGLDYFVVTLRDVTTNAKCSGFIQWRVNGESHAILTLEEFNSAPPSVMAASYQLILDRRIGDYIVPNGVMILATGNRDGDHGVTFQIPKPVANRFVHIEMQFNWQDWFMWASNHQVHPDVVGYLSRWPSKTNEFDPESPSLSFATPRTWEFVSKIISQPVLPSADVLRALICGAIGDAIGTEFLQHRKFMADMPDAKDIISGNITAFVLHNRQFIIQISYSVSVQICYELKLRAMTITKSYQGAQRDFDKYPARIKWLEDADRAFGYIIDHFPKDVVIAAMRMAIVVHDLPLALRNMPRFRKFTTEHQDVVLT